MSTDRVVVWTCIFTACLLQSFTVLASNLPHHCPELQLISVGRVTPYYTDENYQPAVIGDVATYSCVQGYQLVGDVTRLCVLNTNGTTQWTGTEPYCTIVYCDDPGTPKDAIRHGNSFQYGERVWYSCYNYTQLVGPRYLWCNGDGEWSDEPPLCRSYNRNAVCPPIAALHNGHTVGGKKIGEQLWFACKSGYTLIGPSTIRCQLNRTWSDKPPICVQGCTNPPVITNGHFIASFAPVGYTINYKCDSCYKMDKKIELKCLPNMTWSQPHPKCERITCDNPMSTMSEKRSHQFFCDAELVFECEEGFRMVGVNKLRCMESGNWSNSMPICEYIPPIGNCPELPPPANGAVSYSSDDGRVFIAEYTCNTGYGLIGGDMERFCNNDEKWNGTAPSCSDENERCPFLEAPSNGFVVITGFQTESNATYFCNDGYVLMNGDQVLECMPDHHWSGKPASCQKMELMCTSPPLVVHAKYEITVPANSRIDSDQLHNNVVVMGGINQSENATTVQPTTLMFLVGSVASYSCKKRFVMTGGGPSLMCFSNGSWVGDIGKCEALQCPQPEEHPNSFVIANDLSIGSQATYHCYHGYHASVNTSLSITCQESGKWTSLKGKCSAVECGYPPVKDDVVVKGSNFTYSSEGVLLRCKRSKEQRRQKPVQINCLSNSSWSVQEFSCSDGACPVDVNFDVCNYTSFALIGKLESLKRSIAFVSVTKYLYQDIPKRNKKLKISLASPDDVLLTTMTCCKRLSVNSNYIFAGTYLVDGNKLKPIVNGCRTIYRLPTDETSSVDTINHSFLDKCQFRILASN